jgi:hypothetical protein
MRLLLSVLGLVALGGVQTASADVFNIDRDNATGALCTVVAPCGTVTVTGTTTLHVVISMNSPFGVFSNNDTFGFNVVGSTAGLAMSNFSNSSFDGTGGSGNEDGWGTFAFRVSGPGGSSGVSTLSFDVTRTGGFTGPSDIEAGATGGNGYTVFGLHVTNNASPKALTGFAGVDLAAPVPEPGSILLLSTVLLGVCMATRKGIKGLTAGK